GGDPAEMRLEFLRAQQPGLAAGHADRHRLRNQPLEPLLIERVAPVDLVRRRVDLRPNMVPTGTPAGEEALLSGGWVGAGSGLCQRNGRPPERREMARQKAENSGPGSTPGDAG